MTVTNTLFADEAEATITEEKKEDWQEVQRAKQQVESHVQELTNKHPNDEQGVLVGRLHRKNRRRDTNG
jgi:hypothetical protein